MLSITPRNIVTYSKCPKKAAFSWHQPEETSTEFQVISDIIKTAYLYYERQGKPPAWRNFMSWTQRKVFNNTVKHDRLSYKEGKSYLSQLSNFYEDIFLNNYCVPGLINVPISVGLGQHIVLEDTIDILSFEKKLIVFDFKEIEKVKAKSYTSNRLYNDLLIHVRSWILWKVSGALVDEYVRILIGPQSVGFAKVSITEASLLKIEGIVRQITRGMKDGIYYPSFSEQCGSCPFKAKCRF